MAPPKWPPVAPGGLAHRDASRGSLGIEGKIAIDCDRKTKHIDKKRGLSKEAQNRGLFSRIGVAREGPPFVKVTALLIS